MPSSAFTVKASGYLKPASSSADTSVFSRSITLLPGGVVEHGLGRRVDARRVVHEERVLVVHRHRVRRVARIQQLHRARVEVHAVEVLEVRILARFPADGREVQRPRLLVDVRDAGRDELAGRDLPDHLAADVVQVVVAPAVALGPVNRLLAAVDQAQRLDLDVGVRSLGNDDASTRRSSCRPRRCRCASDRGSCGCSTILSLPGSSQRDGASPFSRCRLVVGAVASAIC